MPDFQSQERELCFVGGVAKWLNGQGAFESIGDIDILIRSEEMARKFWDLVEKLIARGMRSLYDVRELPKGMTNWNPCFPSKWHPRTLAIDCTRTNEQAFKLDIFIDPNVFLFVPNASSWVGNDSAAFEPDIIKVGSPEPVTFADAIPRIKEYLASH